MRRYNGKLIWVSHLQPWEVPLLKIVNVTSIDSLGRVELH
jgi:hypothetical protein